MEILKLNETPVRTSRNFRINNIKIEDFEIPQISNDFENIEIQNTNALIENNVSKANLTYGNSKELEENVNNYSNSNMKITSKKSGENIVLKYDLTAENMNLVNNIEIIANHDMTITIVYKSSTKQECYHNGIIRSYVNEKVKLNVNIINLINNNSYYFEAIENKLEKDSNLKYTIVDFGGKYSVTNFYSDIFGESAKCDLKSVYLGKDLQIKDLNYIAELRGEKTVIDIDVQGALKDESHKNFKGTIDFKRGSRGAKGDENEFCMLLSPKAKSLALPMLLCTEDDVEGNHSTASGKVDEKSLFYIMSRGLSQKDAIKLIIKARFNKIIDRIKDEEIKEEVLKEIDKRLG